MEIDTSPSEYQEIELRPLNCRLDAHTRSDGSAMLSQGILNNDDVVHNNAQMINVNVLTIY